MIQQGRRYIYDRGPKAPGRYTVIFASRCATRSEKPTLIGFTVEEDGRSAPIARPARGGHNGKTTFAFYLPSDTKARETIDRLSREHMHAKDYEGVSK